MGHAFCRLFPAAGRSLRSGCSGARQPLGAGVQGWRPNLLDEDDNHLIELAIAGHAQAVVTHNVRDLTRGELVWPHLRVLTPAQFLEELL